MWQQSPKSILQSDFVIFWNNVKNGLFFLEQASLQLYKRITPFSGHINVISFDICHCFDFFMGVLAVYLKKTMVMFNLRKKHWPWVKTQICFPGLKFVFPRTWPWSNMILEWGHVFSFSIFAFPLTRIRHNASATYDSVHASRIFGRPRGDKISLWAL